MNTNFFIVSLLCSHGWFFSLQIHWLVKWGAQRSTRPAKSIETYRNLCIDSDLLDEYNNEGSIEPNKSRMMKTTTQAKRNRIRDKEETEKRPWRERKERGKQFGVSDTFSNGLEWTLPNLMHEPEPDRKHMIGFLARKRRALQPLADLVDIYRSGTIPNRSAPTSFSSQYEDLDPVASPIGVHRVQLRRSS